MHHLAVSFQTFHGYFFCRFPSEFTCSKQANAVDICKNTFKYFATCEAIPLTSNERVWRIGDYERDKDFTKFLLNIGDGLIPVCKGNNT
jgi:hypothetical protein